MGRGSVEARAQTEDDEEQKEGRRVLTCTGPRAAKRIFLGGALDGARDFENAGRSGTRLRRLEKRQEETPGDGQSQARPGAAEHSIGTSKGVEREITDAELKGRDGRWDGNEIDASVWLEMPDPLRFWDRSSAAPAA
ncbi:hypothetical protein VTN00DRAFT_5563 [Thermoascus crustaceus]|uniref:uncharacterized protein n=1 Tax=Thermoascus crustaceus TaxID=5088 RepID=UPI00374397DA